MSTTSLKPVIIHESHLEILTNLSEISRVLKWFEEFEGKSLPTDTLWKIRIALIEGFTNAVRHAHKNKPESTPIIIDGVLFSEQLEIRIWDCGAEFDLAALINTVHEKYPDPEEHDAHWGGTIFRKLSLEHGWTIQYQCLKSSIPDRNCLTMQIPL